MLILEIPLGFKVGDTMPVRVNGQETTLWWRDAQTLVLGENDARRILHLQENDGGVLSLVAGDAADLVDRPPTITVTMPDAAGDPVDLILANLPPAPEGEPVMARCHGMPADTTEALRNPFATCGEPATITRDGVPFCARCAGEIDRGDRLLASMAPPQ